MALFIYVFSLLLFGANGIIAHHIPLPSPAIVFSRVILGAVFLFLLLLIKREPWQLFKHLRELPYIFASGIAIGASWLCLYAAYNLVGVGIATLLYNCGPIIVIILGILIFKEKLTKFKALGIISVFLGVICLNSTSTYGELNFLGLCCGLAGAGFYALMVLSNKYIVHVKGCENTFWQLLFSYVVVIPFFLFTTPTFDFQLNPSAWTYILLLGIVNTGFACFLYFSTIPRLPMSTVAICAYLESVSAVAFACIFLKELLAPLQWIGLILIICGAIVAEEIWRHFKKS